MPAKALRFTVPMSPPFWAAAICLLGVTESALHAQRVRSEDVIMAMKRAGRYYWENVASHGGYVYHYSLDLNKRWGEGEATKDQIWVQPPGTPTVGMSFLKAHQATGDPDYLDAATRAAEALVYGQVQSGGWTNCIDFNPKGKLVSQYRNGKGRGRNISSLDDGQTASALLFLIRTDEVLEFKNAKIHEAVQFSLDAVLGAQFPNGAFPQVWEGRHNPRPPILKASYPEYDWRTEGRVKDYWNTYTLNDNVPGYVTETLLEAHRVYKDDRYLDAVKRLGDFLLLAQLPDPQPGWAQQYNYDMKPIWARKFEPPGVSGDETQETLETLMQIASATGDDKYLEPIPRALAYLKKSQLRDGRLARYYELKTNRPLYMERRGDVYSLTYDDSNLPSHYGWKTESRIQQISQRYHAIKSGKSPKIDKSRPAADVQRVIRQLDDKGRWISVYDGQALVGQPKFSAGYQFLSSEVFSANLDLLSEYLVAERSKRGAAK
jgi:hypothetical protein